MSDVLDPITHEYELSCSRDVGFETYARRIGEWWDPRYTVNAETLESVTIEPCMGGRVYARHSDVGEDEWGEVTAWEPGRRRLVHTFTLAQDPLYPSEVAVEFLASGVGCTMRFVHGGWTEANAGSRPKFGDWRVMLDRFAALVQV